MRSAPRMTAAVSAAIAIGVSLGAGMGGWPGGSPSLLLGYPDCEVFGTGVLAQPTNALTSLAFVPLGIWVVGDPRFPSRLGRVLVGSTLIGVGIGSFIGHAAATDWARAVDSIAIKVMVVTFGVYALSQLQGWGPLNLAAAWTAATVLVVVVGIGVPELGTLLLALLAIPALILTALVGRHSGRPWVTGGVAVLGIGALAWWLGGPDSNFCAPRAVFQLHGVWHILAATGIAMVYQVHRTEVS